MNWGACESSEEQGLETAVEENDQALGSVDCVEAQSTKEKRDLCLASQN